MGINKCVASLLWQPELGSVLLTGFFCLVNKEHLSQRAPNYYHVAPVRDLLREAHPANTRLMTSAPL